MRQIRGAPAIATLASLSFAANLESEVDKPSPAAFLDSPDALRSHVVPILDFLYTARPTAVNLGTAIRRLKKVLEGSASAGKDVHTITRDLIAEAHLIADEDVGRNKEMSKFGGEWLVEQIKGSGGSGEGLNVLTVCNTGSLATSVRALLHSSMKHRSQMKPGLWNGIGIDYLPS